MATPAGDTRSTPVARPEWADSDHLRKGSHADPEGFANAATECRLRGRREFDRNVTEIDEVGRDRAKALQILFEADRTAAKLRLRELVDRLRHEHVLSPRDRILEHTMGRDHVDSDQLGPVSDDLRRDLPEVRDELHPQPPDLATGVTSAEVVRDHPVLPYVEGAVHLECERKAGARRRRTFGFLMEGI
jgi:hypothetical protein